MSTQDNIISQNPSTSFQSTSSAGTSQATSVPTTSTTVPFQSSQSQTLPVASTSAAVAPSTSLTAQAGPSTSTLSTSAANTNGTAAVSSSTQQQTRQEAELARKDRTLAEFMLMLDDYEPLIPNEVTDYYLQRVGFECDDIRLKRLLTLAAQKFVSDIAADAYQHARIRTNAAGGGRGRLPIGGQSIRDKTKTTLTMEDLSAALSEYGVNSRKPEFYM